MKIKKVLEADRCRFAAQVFNLATILAVIIPIPLLMIWIGGLKGVLVIWALIAAGLIPAAIREIFKARREAWRDIELEVPVNE